MTDQSNVFNTEETPQTNPATTVTLEDQLKMIKNETGEQKYDSVPKALEALQHSQSFISTLKDESSIKDAEIAALKEELAKRAAVEDVVSKLSASQETDNQSDPQVQGLDEAGVAEIFNKLSAEQAAAKAAKENESAVNQALLGKFGDKAGEMVAAKAAELGMSVEGLQQLSRTSPAAALQLFQAGTPKDVKPTTGSYTIPANQQPQEEIKLPEKSLLRGAKSKDQIDFLRQLRDKAYKKHGIET